MDWSHIVLYHSVALVLGVLLDRIIGDPYWLPHPIRAIGALIAALDKQLMDVRLTRKRVPKTERLLGVVAAFVVLLAVGLTTALALTASYWLNRYFGMTVEAVLTAYLLAGKSLRVECIKVRDALTDGSLTDARLAVSMIVGRDVDALDSSGVTRAAVETSAENLSDGVIAPLFYAALGGPILGMLYKAVNTMDSMVGYRNDRYENYGKFSARLDDVVNFVPARLSAFLAIGTAAILGYDAKNALRIFKRDRFNHKSPNSAQTESVYAGALGLRLAGPAQYFGKLVDKPYIGEETRSIEPNDITRACDITDCAEYLGVALVAVGLIGTFFALRVL